MYVCPSVNEKKAMREKKEKKSYELLLHEAIVVWVELRHVLLDC